MKIKKTHLITIWLVLFFLSTPIAFAQTTAFTYQGKLTDTGTPQANYQMRFELYDELTAGNQIGTTITSPSVAVTQGVFTVPLDFGSAAFDGTDRFLEIAVKRNEGDPFTVLTPRQKLTSAPYSITSANALNLGGMAANTYLQTNGDAAALTNLNADQLLSGTVNDARLSPNIVRLDANNVFTGKVNTLPQVTLSGDGQIIAPRLENSAVEPAPASATNAGRIYFNTTTGSLMVSNGTAWINLSSASRQIQTFSGVTASSSFNCANTTTAIRSATFTKSSDASRLRITFKDTASAFGPNSFTLFVSVRIDGVLVSSPTALRMSFASSGENGLFFLTTAFAPVGYADGVAAGTHTLTTTYNHTAILGGSFTCFRDTEPYLIEIEEIP